MDLRGTLLPSFGVRPEQEVASQFGAIEEKIDVRVESPFTRSAMDVIHAARGMSGYSSIEIAPDGKYTDEPERPQPRPLVNDMITLNRENYGEVIDKYLQSKLRICQWLAKTGAGKSTVFPVTLHLKSKRSVLVIEPTLTLAANAYAFMARSVPQSVGLLDTTGFTGSDAGVIYTTAVCAISTHINRPDLFERFGFIYLDESHYMSGEYYLLRVVLFDWRGTNRIILASATHGGTSEQTTGLGPTIMFTKIRKITVASLTDGSTKEDDQWHFKRISNRWLIFINTVEDCEAVAKYYYDNGVRSGVLHEETTSKEYNDLYHTLNDFGGKPFVVACTAVAETGVTLPVDSVLNLRAIRYMTYNPEKDNFEWTYRRTTEFENQQRAGRVGRLKNGIVYDITVPETKFIDLDDSQKPFAYVLLRLLNYKPLRDVFAEQWKMLEPCTKLGFAQLANCKLHPYMARRYMSDDGRFFRNFKSAIPQLMVNGRRAIFSDKSADMSAYKYQEGYVHPDLNNGRSLNLRMPFHPVSDMKPVMQHFAIEDLRFRSERNDKDITDTRDVKKPPETEPKTKDIRKMLRSFRFKPDKPRATVEDGDEVMSVIYTDEPMPVRTDVAEPKVETLLAQRSQMLPYVPTSSYLPKKQEQPYQVQRWEPPVAIQPPQQLQVYSQPQEIKPLGAPRSVRALLMQPINNYEMVKPNIPFIEHKDFGLWTQADADIVNQLISGEMVLTNMDYPKRCRAHDALCVVWNSVFVAKQSTASKLRNWRLYNKRKSIFGKDKTETQYSDELAKHQMMLDSLVILDTTFQLYQHYVVPYNRELQTGMGSRHSVLTSTDEDYFTRTFKDAVRLVYEHDFCVGVCFVTANFVFTSLHATRDRYDLTIRGPCSEPVRVIALDSPDHDQRLYWRNAISDGGNNTSIRRLRHSINVVIVSRLLDEDGDEFVSASDATPCVASGNGLFLVDVVTTSGMSGSPVFCANNGDLIGILSGRLKGRAAFYAIDTKFIKLYDTFGGIIPTVL